MIARIRRLLAGGEDERGAIMALYVVLLTVLFGVTALVIDGAALRVDARQAQGSADMAAVAGAQSLDPATGGSAHRACQAAWGYVANNAPGAPMGLPDPCAVFVAVPLCTAVTPALTATGDMGPYRVSITTPVPDAHSAMQGRLDPAVDGTACQRLAVTIERGRSHLLAAVIGSASGGVSRTAIARTGSGGSGRWGVPLIVLDPIGCNALTASGQAQLIVDRMTNGAPGMIQIDSDATASGGGNRSCSSSSNYAVDAFGTQNSLIQAVDGFDANGNPDPARIFLVAVGGPGDASAYERADVTAGRLVPRPTVATPVTRLPFDHRYNCKSADGCPAAGSRPPHIDNLRALVGASGTPAGFQVYTGPCKTSPSSPPIVLTPGNWHVPCAKLDLGNVFTITSGNVVFDGEVIIGSSGILTINAANTADSWIYIRSGNLNKSGQASLVINRTMVYLHNGVVTLGGGASALVWSAPFAGDFEDLALWSENPAQHNIGGQVGMSLDGAFFMPNAWPFQFTGQGAQYQVRAQFITFRLDISGQGALQLAPSPDRILPIITSNLKMIR